ncbi:MAG: hypothetical protein EA382_07250 [Spirochaetaceae bacterium]|nr:MAG: hypothetical protein EA382_07250 [Spirochaetaceae bacterium]
MSARTESLLGFIYEERAAQIAPRLDRLIDRYREHVSSPDGYRAGTPPFTERDAVMIALGDSFVGAGGSPLAQLLRFLDDEAEGVISGVHVLPFSPRSSNDPYAVTDHREVDPELGDWSDIEAIADHFMLMADLVLTHCSPQGAWFQGFLRDEPPYSEYFVTASPADDHVDLDFSNPDVLIEMLDVFLGYIARGVRVVRLDSIAYLWTETGTPCLHHPKAHAIVKLIRAIVDEIAPWVVIIVHPSAPHQENLDYLGAGDDEAHMVYDVSLSPLVTDAFLSADATSLSAWVRELHTPGSTSLFNVLGPCDAIAPAALPDSQRARVFLAAQSVALAIAGVPGVYCQSLVGSEDRERLDLDELSAVLNESGSLGNLVFDGYKALLRARAASDAFSPAAAQRVLSAPSSVFALVRTSPTGGRVLCLVNVTGDEAEVSFTDGELGLGDEKVFRELVTDTFLYPSRDDGNRVSLVIDPYEVLWLAYSSPE